MEELTIYTLDTQHSAKQAAKYLFASLKQNGFFAQSSLLLLSGGSCVDVAAEFSQLLPSDFDLSQTTFGLADERWVEPSSQDSNEQQLREKNILSAFEQRGANFVSMLGKSQSAVTSAELLETEYRQLFSEKLLVALLAGMGADGHTLGILPHPDTKTFFQTFSNEKFVVYYQLSAEQDNPHKERITLSLTAVSKIPYVYIYATSENKKTALLHLKNKDETVNKVPALGLYLSEQPVTLLTDIAL